MAEVLSGRGTLLEINVSEWKQRKQLISNLGSKMEAKNLDLIGNNRELPDALGRPDFCVLFHFIPFFTENSTIW